MLLAQVSQIHPEYFYFLSCTITTAITTITPTSAANSCIYVYLYILFIYYAIEFYYELSTVPEAFSQFDCIT